MQRVRTALLSLPVLVLVTYGIVAALFLGLGFLGGTISIVAAIALWAFAAFGMLSILAYEEDWWNNFREQNGALVVAELCQVLLLPASWFLGGTLR